VVRTTSSAWVLAITCATSRPGAVSVRVAYCYRRFFGTPRLTWIKCFERSPSGRQRCSPDENDRMAGHVCSWPAGSTGRRNTGVKSLCWGFKLQGLTWSFVELTSHFVQMGLRVHRKGQPDNSQTWGNIGNRWTRQPQRMHYAAAGGSPEAARGERLRFAVPHPLKRSIARRRGGCSRCLHRRG
jgi:hypothetical protein